MWSLVSYETSPGVSVTAVLREDGKIVRFPAGEKHDLMTLVRHWPGYEAALKDFDPESAETIEGAGRILPPLRYPGKLLMAGANYYDHIAEMAGVLQAPPLQRPADGRKPAGEPFFFLVPPNTTVIGDGEAIRLDDDDALKVDWEAEVAVVIGKWAHRVSAEEAMGCVAGFTIVNDVTARGLLHRSDALGPPFAFDWLRAKGRDTYCPMGPGVTPRWMIDDPRQLPIKLWVNDELKQDSGTHEMVFEIPALIAAASDHYTLEPGDVIATGTPAGVGAAAGEALADGDEIRISIPPLGQLHNPVRCQSALSPTTEPSRQ